MASLQSSHMCTAHCGHTSAMLPCALYFLNMPETKAVRTLAAKVAKELGKTPWHEHRQEVLPVVYAQLGLGAYSKKAPRKRKREAAECCVCFTAADLLILAPCGHKCICAGCCGQLQKCPLCHTLIQATVRAVY